MARELKVVTNGIDLSGQGSLSRGDSVEPVGLRYYSGYGGYGG